MALVSSTKGGSLKQWFALLFGLVLIGFVLLLAVMYTVMERTAVGGPLYGKVIQNNALLADILPPPEYVIDAYLVLRELRLTNESDTQTQLLKRYRQDKQDFLDRLTYWNGQSLPQDTVSLLNKAADAAKDFFAEADTAYIPLIKTGNQTDMAAPLTKLDELFSIHRNAINELVPALLKHSQEVEAEAMQARSHGITLAMSAGVLALFVLAGALVLLLRALMATLGGEPHEARHIVQRIALGDLSLSLSIDKLAPNSLLAHMADMQKRLRDMLQRVRDAESGVSQESEVIASGATQVFVSTQQQSDASTAMASAVEQLSANVGNMADAAREAHEMARSSGNVARDGGGVIRSTIQSMHATADNIRTTSASVQELGQQTANISRVVSVIKDIADQTNLLALNAAIEAARAGEQGRGFAVVAEEVRNLAAKTSTSTEEISSMIQTIQDRAQDCVRDIAESVSRSEEGVAMASQAADAIQRIQEEVARVMSTVENISMALREQSDASDSVSSSVEQIARMAEENSQAANSMSQATQSLRSLAGNLNQSVGLFQLS